VVVSQQQCQLEFQYILQIIFKDKNLYLNIMKNNSCENKLNLVISNVVIIKNNNMEIEQKEEPTTWFIYRINGSNYIGSTHDPFHRQQQHQTSCFNPNDHCHNYPIYKYIRTTDIKKIKLDILGFDNCLKHDALLMENEYSAKHYWGEEVRDKINAKKREKIQCPICLLEYSRQSKARHNKRNHFTNPPTETREDYLERKEQIKQAQKVARKAYMKKLNAKRKHKPKQKCGHCKKLVAHGTLNQHYKYCPWSAAMEYEQNDPNAPWVSKLSD
jgi:hypothetical protein